MRIEGEPEDVEQVEANSAQCFLGRFLDQFGADCAVFGTDADGDSLGVAARVGELASRMQLCRAERGAANACLAGRAVAVEQPVALDAPCRATC